MAMLISLPRKNKWVDYHIMVENAEQMLKLLNLIRQGAYIELSTEEEVKLAKDVLFLLPPGIKEEMEKIIDTYLVAQAIVSSLTS